MALILEDGSGKTNSQTYVLGADVAAYARLYGLAPPVSADADIMKAMRYVEGAYYERWIGLKKTENQALSWPRAYAVRRDGWTVDESEIPKELKDAVCALALRSRNGDNLIPDLTRSDSVLEEQIGPIRVKYDSRARSLPLFRDIEFILKPICQPLGFPQIVRT
jgi:hypothetical protein